MRRRENAILLGIGTTRRKFRTTNSEPGEMYTKIPAVRYVAKSSGMLCKGNRSHKCLFNKGDMLEVLCPETVVQGELATFYIHRAFNGKDMLMQRDLRNYEHLLKCKGECVLSFKVTQIGHFSYGGYEECLCIQPVPGVNLWVDERLTVHPEEASTQKSKTAENMAGPDDGINDEFRFYGEFSSTFPDGNNDDGCFFGDFWI